MFGHRLTILAGATLVGVGFFTVGCEQGGDPGGGDPAPTKSYCPDASVDLASATDDEVCGKRCCNLCPGEFDDSSYRAVYPDNDPEQRCLFDCANNLAMYWDTVAQADCKRVTREWWWCRGGLNCTQSLAEESTPRCDRLCGEPFEAYQQYCRCQAPDCPAWDVGGARACVPANYPEITSFTINSDCVQLGDPVTLTWTTNQAVSCKITGPMTSEDRTESSAVAVQDSLTFTAQYDAWGCWENTWSLECLNAGGDMVSDVAGGCAPDCVADTVQGDGQGSGNTACSDCLKNCEGLSSCCIGTGCICKDECTPSSCSSGKTRCCDNWGFCMCVTSCPY